MVKITQKFLFLAIVLCLIAGSASADHDGVKRRLHVRADRSDATILDEDVALLDHLAAVHRRSAQIGSRMAVGKEHADAQLEGCDRLVELGTEVRQILLRVLLVEVGQSLSDVLEDGGIRVGIDQHVHHLLQVRAPRQVDEAGVPQLLVRDPHGPPAGLKPGGRTSEERDSRE